MSIKAVAIFGPTGSGKSELAIKLARHFNGVIINCDVWQSYKPLPLTTNQPSQTEKAMAKHLLVGFRPITHPLTAAEFQRIVYGKIQAVHKARRLPILVGGSGLYLRGITEFYDFSGKPGDNNLREQLEVLSEEELVRLGQTLYPDSGIDWNNRRRVIRLIEKEGQPGSTLSLLYGIEFLKIAPHIDPQTLKQKLDQRVDHRIRAGMLKEITSFLRRHKTGPLHELPYMKPVAEFLKDRLTKEALVSTLKAKDRQIAKKQMTWLRKEPRLIWVKNYIEAKKLVANFLKAR